MTNEDRKPSRIRLWDKNMNLIGEINPNSIGVTSGGETDDD